MATRCRLGLPLLVLILLLLFPGLAVAKDWAISYAQITATLDGNGDMAVAERRTYWFDGTFSHLWQLIELPDRSELQNLTLADARGYPYGEADTKEPGTYHLTKQPAGWQLDWYISPGPGEITFELGYTVKNAVRMHADGAELYWDLIGGKWERGTGLAEITLELPEPAFDAWAEGTEAPVQVVGRLVRLTVSDIPKEHAVAIRALLPRQAIPGSLVQPDDKTVQAIRAKAGRVSDERSRTVQQQWIFVALAYGAWFFVRRVVRPMLEQDRLVPDEEPQPLPPAALAALHDKPVNDALRATLVDLAEKGALRIESHEGRKRKDWRFSRTDASIDLDPFDRRALDAFFPPHCTKISLRRWRKLRAQKGGTGQRLEQWYSEVKQDLPGTWFAAHDYWIYLVALIGVAVTVLTYPGPTRVASGFFSAGLVLLGLLQPRYTKAGYRQLALWHSVGDRLAPSLAIAVGLKIAGGDFDLTPLPLRSGSSGSDSSDGGGSGDGGDGGGDGGGGGGAE